jgi:hypothetical protein
LKAIDGEFLLIELWQLVMIPFLVCKWSPIIPVVPVNGSVPSSSRSPFVDYIPCSISPDRSESDSSLPVKIKKPPDISVVSSEPFDDTDEIPLYASRVKKLPDKLQSPIQKAFSILDDSCISCEDALVELSFPCSKIPISGVDGVRLKKKKRKRKKGKGLLSRKNFIYNKGQNSWTLVGDYHVPPVAKPLLTPPRKKKKKKVEDHVVNYTDSADVKWALVNRVTLNAYCSGFRETPIAAS